MKKFGIQNILYGIAGGLTGLIILMAFSPGVEGGEPGFNFFTVDGGTIGIDQLQLSRKHDDDRDYPMHPNLQKWSSSVLNSKPENENAMFRLVGSSVFDNILSFEQVRFDTLSIGYPGKSHDDESTAVQVNGTITIKSLADPSRTEPVPACVNDFGVISLCDEQGSGIPK
jgi:hypothetical protein